MNRDENVDDQIMQIGANIIDQFDPIVFPLKSPFTTAWFMWPYGATKICLISIPWTKSA